MSGQRGLTREQLDAEDCEILRRMAAGEYACNVAEDLGITRQALRQRLIRRGKHRQYKAAMDCGGQIRLLAMLRQAGDVPRQHLTRLILYCERNAPKAIKQHSVLIRQALWSYARPNSTNQATSHLNAI